jgi:hypothetical protein
VDEVQVQDQTMLHVYVPESSQVHRCNGRIFDRNEDGDFDITDHTRLVSELYQRKQATYSENKVYPYAGLIEGDVFRIIVKVPEFGTVDSPQELKEATILGAQLGAQSETQSQNTPGPCPGVTFCCGSSRGTRAAKQNRCF